jgi:truncated hemoglobin YjbI
MSKLELQYKSTELSGISFQDSQRAIELQPCIYERIGIDGIRHLSRLFYERVYSDHENQWFRNIFASSTKADAIDNQYRYLVQILGGPPLYKEKKGKYTRLVGRHANYNIGANAAKRWVLHMQAAIAEHELLVHDEEASAALSSYFQYTAYYIVCASEYMRSDQLSGGQSMDENANW